MDAERMLGSLLRSGLSGGSGGGLGRLASGGLGGLGNLGGLGGLAGGGLNTITRGIGGGGGLGGLGRMGAVGLLGGIAVAAADHFLEKRNQPSNQPNPPIPPSHPPHHAGTAPPPPPPPPISGAAPVAPPTTSVPAIDPTVLIRAMVAAAAADGVIDVDERARLLDAVRTDQGDAEDLAYLEDLLASPPELNAIVAETPPGAGPTVYTAAVMAIVIDTPAERFWLQALAARLGLDPTLVAQIHAQAGAPAP